MKGDTMPEFSTMLDLQAQMMLLLAIGVFLAKKKLITDQGRACLTDLLLFIILPANIIQSFRIEFNAEIFRSTRDILILSILLQVLYGVVCAVCYNRYPFARKAVMQYGTVCSNAGFLGSPLAEGLFGGVGLLLTSFYLIPQRIVMWSVGVSYFMQDDAAASPGGRTRHRAVLRIGEGLVPGNQSSVSDQQHASFLLWISTNKKVPIPYEWTLDSVTAVRQHRNRIPCPFSPCARALRCSHNRSSNCLYSIYSLIGLTFEF